MTLLHAIATLMIYGAARSGGIPPVLGGLVALQVASSPLWFTLESGFMSDPLFAVLGMALAWYLYRIGPVPGPGSMVIAGFLIAAMYLTRTAALPFLFMLVAWSANRCVQTRRWVWLAAPVAPLVALGLWTAHVHAGFSYQNYLSDNIRAGGGWLAYLPRAIRQTAEWFMLPQFLEAYATGLYNRATYLPGPLPLIIPLAGICLSALCCVGIRRRWSQEKWPAGAVFLYLLQVGIWPFPLGGRAALVLLPWVVVWAFSGLRVLSESHRLATLRLPTMMTGLLSLALATNAVVNVHVIRSNIHDRRENSQADPFLQLANWTRTNIPTNAAILVVGNIPRFHLHSASGRQFKLGDGAIHDRPAWIIGDQEVPGWLEEGLATNSYQIVFKVNPWKVYQRQ